MRGKRAKEIRRGITQFTGPGMSSSIDYINDNPRELYRKCGKKLARKARHDWKDGRGTGFIPWWRTIDKVPNLAHWEIPLHVTFDLVPPASIKMIIQGDVESDTAKDKSSV